MDSAIDMRNYLTKLILLIVLGAVLVIAGLLQYFLVPYLIKNVVTSNFLLSPTSRSYQGWRLAPIPIYNSYYMFNITNSEDVLKKRSAPILQELGPYTFIEQREKVGIEFHANGTVSYRNVRRYHFEPQLSQGSLTDQIFHLNVPMISAGNEIKRMTGDLSFLYSAIEDVVIESQSNLFLSHTVGELLFDGYEDDLLYIAKELGMTPEGAPPVDRFGWFYARNDTSTDGIYEVYTGQQDVSKFGSLVSWNYHNELNVWSEGCNEINDTFAGDFQPPYFDRPKSIKIFAGDMCRSIKLNFNKEVEYNGLKLRRYASDSTVFNYSLTENQCYCSETKGCPDSGVADVSQCSFGAPVALSLPHFLFADDSYRKAVIGLTPDVEKHQFYMDIEPTLGIPIRTAGRLQLNIVFQRNENLFYSSNLSQKEIYYPQFWTNSIAIVDDETVSQLSILINIMPIVIPLIAFVCIFIGCILLNIALLKAIRMKRLLENAKRLPCHAMTTSDYRQNGSNNSHKYIPVSNDKMTTSLNG